MACRICLEETGELISPCACKGTTGYVHSECLDKWIHINADKRLDCEICHHEFQMEEVCSFQPYRYCFQCWRCRVKHPTHMKFLFHVFGLTLVIASWTPIEQYIFLSAISTLVSLILIVVNTIAKPSIIHNYFNLILSGKCAFSLAYFIAILTNYIVSETRCEDACMSIGHSCDYACPVYKETVSDYASMDNSCLFELVNIFIMVIIRGIFLCCVYMRKTQFQNLIEENRRLLYSSAPPSPSSSSPPSSPASSV